MRYPSWFGRPPWMHVGALLFFVILMLFDFRVAFHTEGGPPDSPLLSVTNGEARAGNLYSAYYGLKFVSVRSDLWSCFRMRDIITVNLGVVSVTGRCQEPYTVVVQTEACQLNKSDAIECAAGTWRWVPNPPCGTDSPSGWWLPPC